MKPQDQPSTEENQLPSNASHQQSNTNFSKSENESLSIDHDVDKKAKPPLAAQILYALGFLGLLGGLMYSLLLYLPVGNVSFFTLADTYRSPNSYKIMAIIIALLTIAVFTLINFIRGGKKWALITYSILTGLATVSTLASKEFSITLLGNLITITLLGILWTKNLNYFK